MEKDYLVGQLEKKLSDEKYYIKSKFEKKKEIITEVNSLLGKLKKMTIEEDDKKVISKTMIFLNKMRSFIK